MSLHWARGYTWRCRTCRTRHMLSFRRKNPETDKLLEAELGRSGQQWLKEHDGHQVLGPSIEDFEEEDAPL